MAPGSTASSDPAPKDLHVGAINPYALAQAILNRPIDGNSVSSVQLVSDALQANYNELFDMKYDSVLHAGLKLNDKDNTAEPIPHREMRILTEEDLATPSLAKIRKLADLQDILKDVGETRVRDAWIHNGDLKLVLQPRGLVEKISNSAVTDSIAEMATTFRLQGRWSPPNSTWRNASRFLQEPPRLQSAAAPMYNNPVQGAVGNSWLIAAIFALAWADPYRVVHRTLATTGRGEENHVTEIQLYSKGGRQDARSEKVKVNDEIVINNSSHLPVYSHSTEAGDLYPALYEKAFAKWINRDSSDRPDLTQTAYGDPIKAMAQMNDKTAHYYYTSSHSAEDLWSLVRASCVNFKTIHPMAAWTHASHESYRGSTLVGNHAYTVLGWAGQGGQQYIVVRNPWAVTEPTCVNTYPGLMNTVDIAVWPPIRELDGNGVFAVEMQAFKNCFAGIGVAK